MRKRMSWGLVMRRLKVVEEGKSATGRKESFGVFEKRLGVLAQTSSLAVFCEF